MSRKSIVIIAGIVVCCLCAVAILYALSEKPMKYAQNFERIFRDSSVKKMYELDLQDPQCYVAGCTTDRIYFASKTNPTKIIITDPSLKDRVDIHVSLDSIYTKEKSSYIEIDSPYFFVKQGQAPALFRGVIDSSWRAERILPHTPYFTSAVPVSASEFIVTMVGSEKSSDKNIIMLARVLPTSTEVSLNTTSIKTYGDNFLNATGTLRYNEHTHQLIYVYAYKNQYVVMDTMLNVNYEANTIDTVSHPAAAMEISKGVYSFASPKAVVNKNAQVNNPWLLVQSNLMAVNEDKKTFDNSSVIDVYDLRIAKYKFSIHVPDVNKNKVDSYRVSGNNIIVVCGQYAISYAIDFNPKSTTDQYTSALVTDGRVPAENL